MACQCSAEYLAIQQAIENIVTFQQAQIQPNGKPKNYKFNVAIAVLEALVGSVQRTPNMSVDETYDNLVNVAWLIANKMDAEADTQ